jgi:protein O-mannosyl-transferase
MNTTLEASSRWSVRQRWLAAALIVAAVLVAFSPALPGPFLFDDADALPGNPAIERPTSAVGALAPPRATTLTGRPLTHLSFVLNAAVNRAVGIDRDSVGKLRALGFRAGNLLLHLITGFLLFGLVRRTMRGQRYSSWWSERAEPAAAAIVAIWLLHPLQTEPVNYVVQRTEMLASLFYVATVYAWARGWEASPSRRRAWRIAAVLLCVAGMGSKEMAVTAPLMVLLYDRAFVTRSWRELLGNRERVAGYLGLFASTGVVVYTLLTNSRASTVGFDVGMPVFTYLLSQGWAIMHYLRLSVWPSGLTLDYGRDPVSAAGWPGLAVLALGGLFTVYAWVRAERLGWLAFTASWFYLILAPSSSFVPIVTEIAAERRMYLPLAAVVLLAAVGTVTLLRRLPSKGYRWMSLIPAALCAAAAVVTFTRSKDYRSAEIIWRDAVQKRPTNARAKLNLGGQLLISNPPRLDEAERLFLEGVRLEPTDPPLWYNLGEVAIGRGDLPRAQAMYQRVLAIEPGHPKGRPRLDEVTAAIARQGVGMSLAVAAKAALEAGQPDSAVVLARRAVDAADVNPDVLGLVASVFLRTNNAAAAEVVLVRATAEDPGNPQLWTGLGNAFGTQEKWDSAEQAFRRALGLDGKNTDAQRGLDLVLELRRIQRSRRPR